MDGLFAGAPAVRRFWISPEQVQAGEAFIEGELFHHIRDVCRFDVGSRFELLPGDGRALFAEIIQLGKRDLKAKVLEERQIPPLPRPHVHLLVAMPKFATFETILEKAAELGVSEITPLFTDYSFVRGEEKLSPSRWARWEKIIRSASQQCGRGRLMTLRPAIKLTRALDDFNRRTKVLGLFPYEGESAMSLKARLGSIPAKEFEEVWIFVGSEGGFSQKEVELFQAQGLPPLSLGDQILRVETACLALVSVIKYHFEEGVG
jgi:16S rRNA (uracil1498-N3)-methyltransferase